MSPERTRAIVVGVETYGQPPYDVTGPAHDAVAFAGWLTDRGVPKRNITLLVSRRQPGDLAGWGTAVSAADMRTVEQVFQDEVAKSEGDLLVVYWSGRGFDDFTSPYVLFSDSVKRKRTMGVHRLRQRLAMIDVKYPNQLLFFDCCRAPSNEYTQHFKPYEFTERQLRGDGFQQTTFMAVGYGRYSQVLNRTTPFAAALREELANVPHGVWPPDSESLMAGLRTKVEMPEPIMVSTWTQGREHDQFLIGVDEPDERLGRLIRRAVARALYRVDSMGNGQGPSELVGLLRAELGQGFIPAPTPPLVARIAFALSRTQNGWSELHSCLDKRRESLFPPEQDAVIELRNVLDRVRPIQDSRTVSRSSRSGPIVRLRHADAE